MVTEQLHKILLNVAAHFYYFLKHGVAFFYLTVYRDYKKNAVKEI